MIALLALSVNCTMHITSHVTISAVTVPPTADVPGPSGLTYASSMVSGDYRTLGKRQANPNAAENTAAKRHEGVNPDRGHPHQH